MGYKSDRWKNGFVFCTETQLKYFQRVMCDLVLFDVIHTINKLKHRSCVFVGYTIGPLLLSKI